MAGLMYEGDIPDSVRNAAQGALDYAKAIKNKVALAYEGSGVPDSVRKAAQAALERGAKLDAITNGGYAEAASKASPWLEGQSNISGAAVKEALGKGAGILGTGAKFAGGAIAPLTMGYEGLQKLNQSYGPAAYENLQNAVEEGQTRRAMEADPELATRGALTADKVSTQAMDGVRGLMAQGADLNAQAPQEAQAPQPQAPQDQAPQAAPQAPQPAQAPQAPDPAVAAAKKAETEQRRQTIEAGALDQLQNNQLSRTKAAEAVVQADLERKGVDATPAQRKQLVAQEVTSMRSMKNPELAKYLSWAMLAVGVGASLADRTGTAFNNFANAGLSAYASAQDKQLALAKYNQEYQLKLAEQTRKNRDTDSNIDYRTGTLGVKKDANELNKDKFGFDKEYKGTLLDQNGQKIDISRGQLGVANGRLAVAQGANDIALQRLGIYRSRVEAQNAKDLAKMNAGPALKAAEGTTKDNGAFLDNWAKANKVTLNTGVKESVLQQFAIARKNWPAEVAKNPDAVVKRILQSYQSGQQEHWFGLGEDTPKYSLPGTDQ